MPNTPLSTQTTLQVEQAKKFLILFYQKPIAQVSTELFFTIGATIFFAAFAIRPTIITMTQLVKEIQDKKTALTALKNKVATLSTVQSEYFSQQDRFYVLDEAIPENIVFEKVLNTIEKAASDLQLSVTALQLTEVPFTPKEQLEFKNKSPNTVNITMNVTGSYTQIRDYVEQLGNMRPLLTVDSVSLTNGGVEKQDFLGAVIRIEAHYYGKAQIQEDTTTKTGEVSDEKAL